MGGATKPEFQQQKDEARSLSYFFFLLINVLVRSIGGFVEKSSKYFQYWTFSHSLDCLLMRACTWDELLSTVTAPAFQSFSS